MSSVTAHIEPGLEKSSSEKKKDSKPGYTGIDINNLEFGGPIGASALMVWSHYILFYFWYCLETHSGQMVIPTSIDSLWFHLSEFRALFLAKGIPSAYTWFCYFGFFVVQLVLAAYMPGLTMYGVPTAPHGERLPYHCNGYAAYYFCLFGVAFAQFTGLFDIVYIADHFGEFLVASMCIGDLTSLFWYFYGIWTKPSHPTRRTGIFIYDFFMGTCLYPRISFFPRSYVIDIKMIAECRWSWITLMLLTASCGMKMYRENGYVTKEMMVLLYAHWIYSNATAKGEHCIPGTWDMFHENFGWMLNFWNIAGVPFLYCFQSFYILRNHAQLSATLSTRFIVFVFILLNVAYYCFDSANCQKASDKLNGLKRNTFPQVPWGVLKQPVRYIETPKGNLLVDGWYAHVRKLQYTGDIFMALCWGLACGFTSPLPYFYCLFFTCMIIHRQTRDEQRCREKYGEYWDLYVKEVPNVFFPGKSFLMFLLRDRCAQLPPVEIPAHLRERTRLAKEAKQQAQAENQTGIADANASASQESVKSQADVDISSSLKVSNEEGENNVHSEETDDEDEVERPARGRGRPVGRTSTPTRGRPSGVSGARSRKVVSSSNDSVSRTETPTRKRSSTPSKRGRPPRET